MKFKNIIFDWSGVVRDSVEAQFWVVNKIFNKFGVKEMSYEEFKNNWSQPYMDFYKKYMPDVTYEDQRSVYLEVLKDKSCPVVKDYPEIVKLIKNLKKSGRFLAILSSDPQETILPEIKSFGLEDIFDMKIIDVLDKTDGMREIIKNNNLDLGETIIVGDSNHEIEIAKKVGTKSVAVTWGFCSEERLRLKNPDYLVRNIKELEDILL